MCIRDSCNPMAGEDASKDLLSMIDGNPQTYVEYGKWFYPADLPLEVEMCIRDRTIKVYHIRKYSLQGTTQGRYLTGGVPPVRFSM